MRPVHALFVLGIAAIIAALVSVVVKPSVEARSRGEISAAVAVPDTAMSEQNPQDQTRRTARLSIRPDGHYWVRALVNRKASVEFMVDTGASVVALTYDDAQKMGLDPASLDYKWTIRTAGGETLGASVTIDSIRINQVHIRDVEAMVLRSDLSQSLLGMSFLNELYSYEFRGDRMIIRQ